MVKTQIQLPDCLYREAKRVAAERELSLAEVLRRGVDYITRVYPPLTAKGGVVWELPAAVRTNLRPGIKLASLRDMATADAEPHPAPHHKSARHGTEE
jgi:hypothetical protein